MPKFDKSSPRHKEVGTIAKELGRNGAWVRKRLVDNGYKRPWRDREKILRTLVTAGVSEAQALLDAMHEPAAPAAAKSALVWERVADAAPEEPIDPRKLVPRLAKQLGIRKGLLYSWFAKEKWGKPWSDQRRALEIAAKHGNTKAKRLLAQMPSASTSVVPGIEPTPPTALPPPPPADDRVGQLEFRVAQLEAELANFAAMRGRVKQTLHHMQQAREAMLDEMWRTKRNEMPRWALWFLDSEQALLGR